MNGVQINSFIKFGSLAFDVASDTKVRELLGMVHHGARRRGLIGVPQGNAQGLTNATNLQAKQSSNTVPSHWPKTHQPIPFSPTQQAKASQPATPAPKPEVKPPAHVENGSGAASSGPGSSLKQWASMDGAKKILGWAETVNQVLNK